MTISGTITNFRETVFRRENPYYTFDLNDGAIAIVLMLGLAATGAAAPSGPPVRIGEHPRPHWFPRPKQVHDGKWVVVWPHEFAAPSTRVRP